MAFPLAEAPELATGQNLEFSLSSEPPADWDAFIGRTSGCVFHTRAWTEIVARGYRSKILYASLCREDEIYTGMTGVVFDFKILKLFFSMMPYGGLAGDGALAPALLEKAEAELRKRGIHQVRLTRLSEFPYPVPDGYAQKKAVQHLIPLAGLTKETLWRGYKKNIRRDVSKARRSGVTVREIARREELEEYYRLYYLTMRRNDAFCHYPKHLYEEIFTQLIAKGQGTVLLASHEGRTIAGSLIVYSADRAYLLGNVSDPERLKLCPNDLLYHEALERALDRGYEHFDLMICDEKDLDLMRFKEKWGGRRLAFGIYQKDFSPLRSALWKWAWAVATSKFKALLTAFSKNA